MRNVLKVFSHDLKALYKHFLALLIILAIIVLPALYAWFNIYAFGDPYKHTDNIPIAVVNNDMDYVDSDGAIVNIGNKLVEELKQSDKFGYVFLDDSDEAINAVYEGEYYAAVVIEPDFTYNMYNFLTTDIFQPTIKFYQNEKINAIAIKVSEAAADSIKHSVNEKYIDAIVETLFEKLNTFSSDVQGETSGDLVRNTLIKVNNNLVGYSQTIDKFINANNSLIDTLGKTNNTLNYSIYLIGNERVNISSQIGYVESTQDDLAKINAEVNNMLLGIQESIQEAIFKLDRLYIGTSEDEEEAKEALDELEAQYQELIDYIRAAGITGADVDDALSALNKLTDKIDDLRKKLGLDSDSSGNRSGAELQVLAEYNQPAIDALRTDFEGVVPSVYEATTGNDYENILDPGGTNSMENMVDFMEADTSDRLDGIEKYIEIIRSTKDPETRNAALTAIRDEYGVLEEELEALGIAGDALGGDPSLSGSVDSASEATRSASDIIEDILNGNRDIDLTRDLQVIGDACGTVRVALTDVVYPVLDNLLENLQDTMGDVSSLLLDLSGIIGKASPIVNQLAETFGTVNNAMIQVKDLLCSYSERLSNLIDLLGGGKNAIVDNILDFFNIDPESIASFLSRPVSMDMQAVYPVKNYGSAMTPFYTMLAIWVGVVIINSILKVDKPVELEGVSETEAFFGRYLIFFLISQLQTLVIMLGDLYLLKSQCLHPGLFLLTGFFTSMVCSMLAYAFAVTLGNIGKALMVVIMIIQIAGSGGSYPIELLPDFFQQIYLFFPFPYAINAMRETIAGLYQNQYLILILKLMIFFVFGLLLGLVLRRSLKGFNEYMGEQLEDTEMM